MRLRTAATLALAALLNVGSAPVQCASDDRLPWPTSPDASEECHLLAGRLRDHGDVAGWRIALGYVVERFPESAFAACARDQLARPPGADGGAPATCASAARPVSPDAPDADEECYLLAGRLLGEGDAAGWRVALEFVVERFVGSRYSARAADELARGPMAASPDAERPAGP